jgi:hypothetical protein
MAKAPPRPHRNKPEATTQADAAPRTREPTPPPPFKASPLVIHKVRQFLHNQAEWLSVELNLLATGTHRSGR